MYMPHQDKSAPLRGYLATPLARIGLIIPSSNRLTSHSPPFAPPELGVHSHGCK